MDALISFSPYSVNDNVFSKTGKLRFKAIFKIGFTPDPFYGIII